MEWNPTDSSSIAERSFLADLSSDESSSISLSFRWMDVSSGVGWKGQNRWIELGQRKERFVWDFVSIETSECRGRESRSMSDQLQ